jgi:2-aminobenzoate-CoA ligase
MAIPEGCLPAQEDLAERIYALPEVRYPERLNLAEYLLDRNVARWGEKAFILYREKRISYQEFRDEADCLAAGLDQIGIRKGDRVLVRGPNIPQFAISNFACWRIGAIPVYLHPQTKAAEIVFRIRDTEAQAMIVSEEGFREVERAATAVPEFTNIISMDVARPGHFSIDELIRSSSSAARSADMSRKDVARIVYSSGTTGPPKGIINDNEMILSCGDSLGRYRLNLQPTDVLCGGSPLSFVFGFFPVQTAPQFGASVVLLDRFSPSRMFEAIETHRVTVLFCIPTAFRMLLALEGAEKKYDLSSLRLCLSAGEWLPASTYREWRKRFGVEILDGVGAADLNFWLCTPPRTPEDKLDSSGIPVPGHEIKVVDEQFRPVPRGQEGEMLVRGSSSQMYWRRPDKQKEAVVNGWNRPGLIFLEDEDGYFWYRGRTDDLIVSAGYKIPGGEVENALNEHPAVLESAVVGSPDPLRNHVVKAFVVLREGYVSSVELAAELQNFVKSKIEPYKYPRVIEFRREEELPRTFTGKIQRAALRDMEDKNRL